MNRRFLHLLYLTASTGFLLLLNACANIAAPSGGEKDTKGPQLVSTVPDQGTLNFRGNDILFEFDEFLKPGSYRKEVFISPVLAIPPEVTVKNKKLRIHFQDNLRPNTTYVITLSTEIKDFNEGNKMEKSFTYAFSTGDQLDSLSINGTIVNAFSGKGQKEMTVLLYREDEILENDIFDVRPIYATQTDESGNYKFEYLREDRYKIYAVGDKDQSFSYNQPGEMLALAESPLINLSDTIFQTKPLPMLAFLPEENGPEIKSAKWINEHTIHVEFSEPIKTSNGSDTLSISIGDTLGGNSGRVYTARYRYKDTKHVYLHSSRPRDQYSDLRFNSLLDTLGNRNDTTVRLQPQLVDKVEQDNLFEEPLLQPEEKQVMLLSYFLLPDEIDKQHVQLRDTLGRRFSIEVESQGYALVLRYPEIPGFEMPYQLTIDSAFVRQDGTPIDTNIVFDLTFPNVEEYGSINGKITPDSTPVGAQWVVFVQGKPAQYLKVKSPTVSAEPKAKSGKGKGAKKGLGGGPNVLYRLEDASAYSFEFLPAGKYSLRYLVDEDLNGYFTPGSLNPYRLPEKIVSDPVPMEIRANWEVENFDLFPTLKLKANVKDLKSSLDGETDD